MNEYRVTLLLQSAPLERRSRVVVRVRSDSQRRAVRIAYKYAAVAFGERWVRTHFPIVERRRAA